MDAQPVFNVLVIAENRLTREGLVRLFANTNFRICAQAARFEDLGEHSCEEEKADIALVSIDDRNSDLIEDIKSLRQGLSDTRVALLMDSADIKMMAGYFEAGIDGLLLTDISTEALMASLALILLGERVFPSQLIPLILRGSAGFAPARGALAQQIPPLSDRETQILGCLVEGNPNKVIANRLDMAEATIKVHVKNILRKVNVENRTQAAIWALHHGLGSHDQEYLQGN